MRIHIGWNAWVGGDESFAGNNSEIGFQVFQEPRTTYVNGTVSLAFYLVVSVNTIQKLLKMPSVFVGEFDMKTGATDASVSHNEPRPVTTFGCIGREEMDIVVVLRSTLAKFYA